jgi:quinol monooxygenase YgiN
MLAAAITLSLAACNGETGGGSHETSSSSSGSSSSTTSSDGGGSAGSGPAGCSRGTIEADFMTYGALAGPGVDPTTGELGPLPATAVVSTTYLTLHTDPASQQKFMGLLQPILPVLQTAPGMIAAQLGLSTSCGTARTLSAWKDEASMLAFAMGPEHAAAEASIGELSTGGSAVTSWETTQPSDVTWATAAAELAKVNGPYY